MGIYHFMGLGKSVGAVTAAFSYMAACRQKGGAAAARLFGLSGEEREAEELRGAAQALVLFTTPQIRRGSERCAPYVLNAPGQLTGQECAPEAMDRALRRTLRKQLAPLVRPGKGLELYWCDVELCRPTLTFQRVVRVLAAAKASGAQGKEVWINLTGGTNILNVALQLSASVTGSAACLYYTLTENEECVCHTTLQRDLGGPNDRFWVDLPIVYLGFSRLHRHILEELATAPDVVLTTRTLLERLKADLQARSLLAEAGVDTEQQFVHALVQPMVAQQLVVRGRGGAVSTGPAWATLQRYFDALPAASDNVPALSHLPKAVDWFFKAADLTVQ